MHAFLAAFASLVAGSLHGYDRVVFRGHLRALSYPKGMYHYFQNNRLLLRDFDEHVHAKTAQLLQASLAEAERLQRPIIYLPSSRTDKEALARRLLAENPVREGLIAVFKCVEPAHTFELERNRTAKILEIVGKPGRCQHVYHYYLHPVFGFMYARVQTWFPFVVQIGLNGREWLARQLQQAGVRYRRQHNKYEWLEDFAQAQALLDQQVSWDWPNSLEAILGQVHPLHAGFLGGMHVPYYWSAFQSEWASDYLFHRRADLERLVGQWLRQSWLDYTTADVLRFLGRAVPLGSNRHRNMTKGEVSTNVKTREDGVRIKHWLDGNSLKLYSTVFSERANLRIEATVNAPRAFRVLRTKENDPEGEKSQQPLRLGVVDLPLRAEVCQAANDRYAAALTTLADNTALREWAEPYCQKVPALGKAKRSARALNPLGAADAALLRAVVDARWMLAGLRNKDLVALLYGEPATEETEQRRRSAQVTRQLRLLRAHGIVQKEEGSHRYHVDPEARKRVLALLAARDANTAELTRKAV